MVQGPSNAEAQEARFRVIGVRAWSQITEILKPTGWWWKSIKPVRIWNAQTLAKASRAKNLAKRHLIRSGKATRGLNRRYSLTSCQLASWSVEIIAKNKRENPRMNPGTSPMKANQLPNNHVEQPQGAALDGPTLEPCPSDKTSQMKKSQGGGPLVGLRRKHITTKGRH